MSLSPTSTIDIKALSAMLARAPKDFRPFPSDANMDDKAAIMALENFHFVDVRIVPESHLEWRLSRLHMA